MQPKRSLIDQQQIYCLSLGGLLWIPEQFRNMTRKGLNLDSSLRGAEAGMTMLSTK